MAVFKDSCWFSSAGVQETACHELSNQSRTPSVGYAAGASEDFYDVDSVECEATRCVACSLSPAAELTPSSAPKSAERAW